MNCPEYFGAQERIQPEFEKCGWISSETRVCLSAEPN